eukprot:2061209-Pleurochrysis_carterae.AAC.1
MGALARDAEAHAADCADDGSCVAPSRNDPSLPTAQHCSHAAAHAGGVALELSSDDCAYREAHAHELQSCSEPGRAAV